MRDLSLAHQELMKIVSMDIPNRKFFENKVKDIYIRHVYQEKYETDVIGVQLNPGALDRKSKQWLGNAISLLVLRGYLGLVVKNKRVEKTQERKLINAE
jgi:hypothetical protein